MKKSSLGRRPSGAMRRPTLDAGSARKERPSGIPIRAGSHDSLASATPSSLLASAVKPRSKSGVRSGDMTPGSERGYPMTGTERPNRQSNMSTNSGRISSYGGSKSKKDNRPIQEREWQMAAQARIEDILRSDYEGGALILRENGNTLKPPLSLKMFIDVVHYFMQKLDSSIRIDKHNYMDELMFLCKKMLYRGKIEKSWLKSANTLHAWTYALALLDFLAMCVESINQVDGLELMYPDNFAQEEKDEESFWNFKFLLPYFLESYEILSEPNYEERQKELDYQIVGLHTEKNVFEQLQSLEIEKAGLEERYELLMANRDENYQKLIEYENKLTQFPVSIEKFQYFESQLKQTNEQHKSRIEEKEKKRQMLCEMREKKIAEKARLSNLIKEQTISADDIRKLKEKQACLLQEIETNQKSIPKFEELLFKDDLNIVSLKNALEECVTSYNLKLAGCISYDPEIGKAKIPENFFQTCDPNMCHVAESALLEFKDKYENTEHAIDSNIKEMEEKVSEKTTRVKIIDEQYESKSMELGIIQNKKIDFQFQVEEKLEELKHCIDDYSTKREELKLRSNDKLEDILSELEQKRKMAEEMSVEIQLYESKAKNFLLQRKKIFEEKFLKPLRELEKKALE